MKTPFLISKQFYLRGLERSDLPPLVGWINDDEVTHYLFSGERPANLPALEEQYENDRKSGNDVVFAVVSRREDRLIGTAGLYAIRWIHRSSEFRIFIGDKKYWNKGIGTEVTKLIVDYAYERLNMNRVYLGVNAEHKGAAKSYEKAGFAFEGTLREECYRNGRYYDVSRYGLLKRDWEKRRGR